MEPSADSLTWLVLVCPLPIRRAAEGWWVVPASNTQVMCIFVIITIFRGKLHDNGICSASSKIYTRHPGRDKDRDERMRQTMGKCV